MASAQFTEYTGLNALHIPYKGTSPALLAVASGEVDFMILPPTIVHSFIATGKVRPVAFTDSQRSPDFPNLPTMQESGVKDYEITLWQGIFMPASTPIEMQKKISEATLKVLSQQSVKDSFTKAGINMAPLNQDDFKKLFLVDIGRWKDIAKKSNIKLN